MGCQMSDYRRCFQPGGTYFFTVVTYNRRPILTTDLGRKCLRQSIETVREKRPFDLVATVLLPDHWHLIMALPRGDEKFSVRMKRIKEEFTTQWLGVGGREAEVSDSQCRRGERGIWQPRFWEHLVRDEDDLNSVIDYIHWNPRKHELVTRIRDWPWLSFHRFVRGGTYDINWGGTAPSTIESKVGRSWGEFK